jgi:hypothetical protein
MKYKDKLLLLLNNINMVDYFDELFYNNTNHLNNIIKGYHNIGVLKTFVENSNIIRNLILFLYINKGDYVLFDPNISNLILDILSYSDQIFIDYDPDEFKKEIIEAAYHPKRLNKWIELGYSVEDWVKD